MLLNLQQNKLVIILQNGLPEVMIENRINHMIEELKSGLEGRGMKFKTIS